MTDYMSLGQQLRLKREIDQKRDRDLKNSTILQSTASENTQPQMSYQPLQQNPRPQQPGMGAFDTQTQQQQPQQQQSNPLQQGLDAYNKYKDVNRMIAPSAGSSLGATGTAYAGSGLGGTGFGLGGSLVSGGASGASAGGGLGSMLGTYGSSAAPSSFGALGSTTAGGTSGLLSGAGASGGSSLGAGAGAGGAAGGGGAAAAGGLGALAAGAFLVDKEMNESKGSMINADKINKMGSVNGIGLRFGDLANGFNPGTWVSDPKKAAKGLGNFFTLGFLDKIF